MERGESHMTGGDGIFTTGEGTAKETNAPVTGEDTGPRSREAISGRKFVDFVHKTIKLTTKILIRSDDFSPIGERSSRGGLPVHVQNIKGIWL
jgi:hypothetical protein